MVNYWLNFVRSSLYPPRCLLCGAPGNRGRELCARCASELPYNTHCCRRCALPLTPADQEGLCGQCLQHTPPFTRAIVPLLYHDPVDRLVTAFKFDGRLNTGRLLSEVLCDRLLDEPGTRPDLLIPVPLHPSRLTQRGFNQALELARPLGRRLDIRIDCTAVARVKATPSQTGLKKRARLRNLRRAFALRRPLYARHLALLDDVVTTGATAATLAALLLRNGAARVDLWAVARTP